MSEDRRWIRLWLGVVSVFTVGVAIRLLPLYWSPLPYNPDGIIAAGLTRVTLRTGQLPMARMATDDFLFTSFLTLVSQMTGHPPLYIAQPAIALVGTAPCLLVVAVARRMGRQRGWSVRDAGRAGVLGALLLAVNGVYLIRSLPVDEQTLGLFLVPLAVVSAYMTIQTGQGRWWVMTGLLLLVLPPLHNLDSMVTAIALIGLLALVSVRSDRRNVVLAAGLLVGGFWGYFYGYNVLVEAFTPARIIQQARITAVPGLLLAWLVASAFVVAWLQTARTRALQGLLLAFFSVLFALLGANALLPIFPSTRSTPLFFLFVALPLLFPIILASWDFPRAIRETTASAVLVALTASVSALIGLSLTANLTPEYFDTALRSQTFLHFPLAVLVGIAAFAALARFSTPQPRFVRRGFLITLVLCAAVSIPVAFAGLEVFTYKAVTTPAELSGTEFATEHVSGAWAADDHIARMAPYFHSGPQPPITARGSGSGGNRKAVYTWLQGGPPPACPTMAQQSWMATGAQLYPTRPQRLSRERFEQWTTHNHVVYRSASSDSLALVVPRRTHSSLGC